MTAEMVNAERDEEIFRTPAEVLKAQLQEEQDHILFVISDSITGPKAGETDADVATIARAAWGRVAVEALIHPANPSPCIPESLYKMGPLMEEETTQRAIDLELVKLADDNIDLAVEGFDVKHYNDPTYHLHAVA